MIPLAVAVDGNFYVVGRILC